MNGSRSWIRLVLAAAVLGSAGLDAPSRGDDAPTLPRYRLKVGQELIYRGGSRSQSKNRSFGYDNLTRAWVTRQNDDGSWRVVLSVRSKQERSTKAEDAAKAARPDDDDDMRDAHLGALDLFPDGRTRLDESITLSYRPTDPETIFPPLPADPEQAKAGWTSSRTGMLEGQNDYRMVEPSVIASDKRTPFTKIYLVGSTARYTFDPTRGVVGRVDTTSSQGYGIESKGTGELVLDKVIDHDAAWAETMARDSDTYFAAQKALHEASERARKSDGDVAALLAGATEALKAARDKVTLPVFARSLESEIKQQVQSTRYAVEEAQTRKTVIGQDAADWELKDLAGATHTMREFRGRVVVLDFWYRGCGWCIRAMPQMKQLADDFRDQPVAILGLNTDENLKDAQFVVDEMGLNYPTMVGAKDVPEKYHVRGFPTLVVVDPQGKIAEFHVGYSTALRSEIGDVIRRHLPAEGKTTVTSPRAN